MTENQCRPWLTWVCGVFCTLAILWVLVQPSGASAEPLATPPGAALFEIHCAGCHPGGSNIIRRGKSLKARALQRHGYDTPDTVIEIITQGKGLMSAYGDRLTPEEIDTLARYVLAQADTGW